MDLLDGIVGGAVFFAGSIGFFVAYYLLSKGLDERKALKQD